MYFKLTRLAAHHPCRWLADWPFIDGADFDIGERIAVDVPRPLEFVLEPLNPKSDQHGPAMPAIFDVAVPLFRDDLVASLTACGVQNIDYYDAVIREPDGSKVYTGYKAANIVGAIAAADMARSRATVHPGGPVFDVEFDELVLDPSKPRGALIFRLAEATGSVFVHDRVRQHLLASGFDELAFLAPGEAFV